MKKVLVICMMLAGMVSGCSRNHFNVPTENFATSVRVLGVAPIMIDADSDIRHPQKEQLIATLGELNRAYEPQLVRKIKATGNFYTTLLLEGDPQPLFARFLAAREKRDDATVIYNKYFWKSSDVREYIQKNNLDAVMLVVISGVTRPDKVSSLKHFVSLSSDYNQLVMTAQVLNAKGEVVWEYPNFRQVIPDFEPLINLQYPDFSEAEANSSATSSANIKFITVDGVRRALDKKNRDLLFQPTSEPQLYSRQFDEIVSLLKYDPEKEKKSPAQPTPAPEAAPAAQPAAPASDAKAAPAVQPITPPPAAQPTAPAPAPQPTTPAPTAAPQAAQPDKASDEIVPAKGSTL